jgi:hypothetical protein
LEEHITEELVEIFTLLFIFCSSFYYPSVFKGGLVVGVIGETPETNGDGQLW